MFGVDQVWNLGSVVLELVQILGKKPHAGLLGCIEVFSYEEFPANVLMYQRLAKIFEFDALPGSRAERYLVLHYMMGEGLLKLSSNVVRDPVLEEEGR